MYVVLSVGNYNKGFFSCDKEHKFRNICFKYNRNLCFLSMISDLPRTLLLLLPILTAVTTATTTTTNATVATTTAAACSIITVFWYKLAN